MVTRLFVPGDETVKGDSRALVVINRILEMPKAQVLATLAETRARFAHRHRALEAVWARNCRSVAQWVADGFDVSGERKLLIGAYFTHEISVESASLCNPSMVAHPNQDGLGDGQLRFAMSLRAVSEGHISCIEFRTGTLGAAGEVAVDPPGDFPESGRPAPGPYRKAAFRAALSDLDADNESAGVVLERLGDAFDESELKEAIAAVHHDLLLRPGVSLAIDRIRRVASITYSVAFPPGTALDERVLWPVGPTEQAGMEDARFVRFVDDDASVTYRGTYTAFDGSCVVPQLIATSDFVTFRVSQFSGPYALNKGLALFPRRVNGQYMALARWDRESSSLATSEDGSAWTESFPLAVARNPWELVQGGNCGSPIETADGWLVITHGVGAMRMYCLGALLLDLDDPRRVIGSLADPLLVPSEGEREGYVPNVVYSCGGMRHGDHLILPYGEADSAVGMARIDIPGLLDKLLDRGRPSRRPADLASPTPAPAAATPAPAAATPA